MIDDCKYSPTQLIEQLGENMHLIFQKIIISSVSEESPLFLAFILVIIININYHSLIDSEATIIIDNNKPLVQKKGGRQLCFVTRLPRTRCLNVDIRSLSCVVRVWACATTGSPTTQSCPVKVIICIWIENIHVINMYSFEGFSQPTMLRILALSEIAQ